MPEKDDFLGGIARPLVPGELTSGKVTARGGPSLMSAVSLQLLLAIFKGLGGQRVEIGPQGVKVKVGAFRRQLIPLQDVLMVYTTMMPKGEDFHEVLALETSSGQILVLDPEEGFDVPGLIQELRKALGERWDDVYLGYKHLSKVRGMEPPP